MDFSWIDKIDTVGSCYLLRMEKPVDFYEARNICRSYGDDVNSVVLDNEVEFDVVAELVVEEQPTIYFYTDFEQSVAGPLAGQPVTSHGESLHQIEYAPWSPSTSDFDDPLTYKGQNTMIYIQARDGKYNTGSVKKHNKGYPLCEKHVKPLTGY